MTSLENITLVFSSLSFLFVFLPIVVILYHLARTINWKNLVLLVSSLVFYAWGEPVYVILMLVSTANDYLHALVIDAPPKINIGAWPRVSLSSPFL